MAYFQNSFVPLDVPQSYIHEYINNFNKITFSTGRLILFAGDQRVEHLTEDFIGPNISKSDKDPSHFFAIAKESKIGALATQLGFIARYACEALNVNYIVKINSKTNLLSENISDPLSTRWYDISDIIEFKQYSGVSIVGIGYTVYLGSQYEYYMLAEAAKLTLQAHRHGLLSILWMYPKGKSVAKPKSPKNIAGAAQVGAALGADFVKVNLPEEITEKSSFEALKEVVDVAGKTGVIVSGGPAKEPVEFLTQLHNELVIGKVSGCAIGRNIHQKSVQDAKRFIDAIYALVIEGKSLKNAISIYKNDTRV